MSQRIEVELGHNIRAWTTFVIADATPEEAMLFASCDTQDEEAIALLRQLIEQDRAAEGDTQYEDNPPMFSEDAEPGIVDVRED